MNERRARELLILSLAASAGVHAALVPPHVEEGALVAVMFVLSAVALAATDLFVDRRPCSAAYTTAALLLGGLLAAYWGSRLTAIWPLLHAEDVDLVGAITKLFEAAGLVLALSLRQTPAGSRRELAARTQGASQ